MWDRKYQIGLFERISVLTIYTTSAQSPFQSFLMLWWRGVYCFSVGIWYIGLRTWYAYAFCIWATTCATSACSSFFLVPQLWCVCYVKVHLVRVLCACGILGWVYGTLGHIWDTACTTSAFPPFPPFPSCCSVPPASSCRRALFRSKYILHIFYRIQKTYRTLNVRKPKH